jgi:Predicted integral membrane protein (DUF2269)
VTRPDSYASTTAWTRSRSPSLPSTCVTWVLTVVSLRTSAPAISAFDMPRASRRRTSVRRAVLTAHIIASVGLLGDSAALLAMSVRAAATGDPELAASSYELMSMFSMLFGIPFSLVSLGTGLALGLGTKWGVLRHRWVTAKLLLILSVIVVGAFVIGPSESAMVDGSGGRESVLVVAAAYDVLALVLATGLSVYKPRRRASR